MGRRLLLASGAVVAAAAAAAPRHGLAAHMSEHVLLLLVAPLLLALGRPLRKFEGWWPWLAAMTGAFVVHSVVMIVWHLPGPFDAAVRHDSLHALEHLSMLVSGYLFWATLLAAPQRLAAVPVLFIGALPGTALGAALTLSTTPWYHTTPSVSSQQLAGVVMWGFGGLVYVLAAAVMFGSWLAGLERSTPRLVAVTPMLLLVVVALVFGACSGNTSSSARQNVVAGGDQDVGARLIRSYDCGRCHTIPGIRGADALVGPPLIHWSRRSFIAGEIKNTPDNLIRWLVDPKAVEPGTDMPKLGISQDEARNIAAYLMHIR